VVLIHNGLRPGKQVGDFERKQIRSRVCRELGVDEAVTLVATVARLDEVKGHGFLLEAARTLSLSHPSLHYVLIGDGPLRAAITAEASRFGLQDRLHLLGERDDILEILPAFDLSVLPSLHEGFPNAVMESMAAGVPVIATSVGGAAELINHKVTGYLVPAGHSAALAAQIGFAVNNPDLTSAVAARGRDLVSKRFDMDRMVASVQEVYDRLSAERS